MYSLETPVPALPPLWLVMVNPGVAVSTAAVFAGRQGGFSRPVEPLLPPLGLPALIDWLAARPNDLEAPARRLAPAARTAARRSGASSRLVRRDGHDAALGARTAPWPVVLKSVTPPTLPSFTD